MRRGCPRSTGLMSTRPSILALALSQHPAAVRLSELQILVIIEWRIQPSRRQSGDEAEAAGFCFSSLPAVTSSGQGTASQADGEGLHCSGRDVLKIAPATEMLASQPLITMRLPASSLAHRNRLPWKRPCLTTFRGLLSAVTAHFLVIYCSNLLLISLPQITGGC